MTGFDFADAVRNGARFLSSGSVERAINEHLTQGKASNSEVVSCVMRAGELDRSARLVVERRDQDIRHPQRRQRSDAARQQQLAEEIRPLVERLRRSLFGRTEPPFSSDSEATAWIRKMCGEVDANALLKQEREVRARFGSIDEWRFSDETRQGPPIYARPEYGTTAEYITAPTGESFCVPFNRPIETLRRETEALATYTLWPTSRLVRHVLTGEKLPGGERGKFWHQTVYPFAFALPGPTPPARHLYGMLLDGDDLSAVRVAQLHSEIRSTFGVPKRRALTTRDTALLEAVRALGGPPVEAPNSSKFWEQVRKRLGSRLPTQAAAREAYFRLKKRLESAHDKTRTSRKRRGKR